MKETEVDFDKLPKKNEKDGYIVLDKKGKKTIPIAILEQFVKLDRYFDKGEIGLRFSLGAQSGGALSGDKAGGGHAAQRAVESWGLCREVGGNLKVT